jgi:hypothetical protein
MSFRWPPGPAATLGEILQCGLTVLRQPEAAGPDSLAVTPSASRRHPPSFPRRHACRRRRGLQSRARAPFEDRRQQSVRVERMRPTYLSADRDPLYLFHQWQANLRILDIREITRVPTCRLSLAATPIAPDVANARQQHRHSTGGTGKRPLQTPASRCCAALAIAIIRLSSPRAVDRCPPYSYWRRRTRPFRAT